MAQWVKVLADKPNDLSWSLEPVWWKETTNLYELPLKPPPHMCKYNREFKRW